MISLVPALLPIALIAWERGPNEDKPGIAARQRKILVFGEKAVAGMDGAGTAGLGRRHDCMDAKIGLRGQRLSDAHGRVGFTHMQRVAIGVGIDRDDAIAEPARGAHDAQRDSPRLAIRILKNGVRLAPIQYYPRLGCASRLLTRERDETKLRKQMGVRGRAGIAGGQQAITRENRIGTRHEAQRLR